MIDCICLSLLISNTSVSHFTLSVRRNEFLKNIKKQYIHALQHIQAYALISKGVKISCSLITGDKRQLVCSSTGGSSTVRDNVVNIFGKKFADTLTPVEIKLSKSGGEIEKEDEGDGDIIMNGEKEKIEPVMVGFVSKSGVGVGRQDSDRQFIYINGRPVDIAKLVRLINSTWRQFEMKVKSDLRCPLSRTSLLRFKILKSFSLLHPLPHFRTNLRVY
jgi:DNA mismatch repair protein PMS2